MNKAAPRGEEGVDGSRKVSFMWARAAVFLYLAFACLVSGLGAHFSFKQYESRLRFAGYKSIVEELASAVGESLHRNKLSAEVLASSYSLHCPNASIWPNCSMPMSHFAKFSSTISRTAEMVALAMSPILTKDQVAPFEEFAYDFFESEGYGPPVNLGVSSIGQGIFARNASNGGALYHTVEEYEGGQNPIFTAVFQLENLPLNGATVMYNPYTEPVRAAGIDEMIACFNATASSEDCAGMSEMIYLLTETASRPASLIFHPISPLNDNTTLVGFTISAVIWENLLENQLPSSIADIDVVISSAVSEYTFTVSGGSVSLKGDGDMHDSTYNEHGVTVPLTQFPHSSARYMLSVYPTADYASRTTTDYPIYASVYVVGIILLTSIVLFMYDVLVVREVRDKKIIMETKRLFVRYISHEIRTPLNTVHLGLVVLMDEMKRVIQDVISLSEGIGSEVVEPSSPSISQRGSFSLPAGVELDVEMGIKSNIDRLILQRKKFPKLVAKGKMKIAADITSWISLINEIEESSDVAVTVLNDLINYDKIVGGLLKMDFSEILLWPIILRTIKPFNLQAKEKNIKLKLYNNASGDYMSDLVAIADKVKIAHVIRNLVSNAIKFTPRGGRVNITVEWIQEDQLSTDMRKIDGGSLINTSIDKKNYKVVGNVRLSVKDSGVGMTGENLMDLFQEGVQFNPNQLQGGQGSGLGLWVSKGFVVRHGGTLTATSDGIGKGSQFSVQLPVFGLGVAMQTSFTVPMGSIGTFTPPSASYDCSMLQKNPKIQPSAENTVKNGVQFFTVDNFGGSYVDEDLSAVSISKKSNSVSQRAQSPMPRQQAQMKSFISSERSSDCTERAEIPPNVYQHATNDVSYLVEEMPSTHEREEEMARRIMMHSNTVVAWNKHQLETHTPLPKKSTVPNIENHSNENSLGLPPVLDMPRRLPELSPQQPSMKEEPGFQQVDLPEPSPEERNHSGSRKQIKTILVVDDATSNRKIMCRLLKNGGFEVYDAEDGHICVEMVAQSLAPQEKSSESPIQFDLILMDFQMPVMNGPVAAKKLRELGYDGPIVGITGNVLDSDMEHFISCGAFVVMSKPIQFNALLKMIRELQ